MAKTRALIIGVSEHTTIQAKNLSFCKNDIYAVKHSFIQGLKVDQSDIILCGSNGTVICSEIINALRHLSDISEKDDSILLYFSGHGTTIDNSHYLVLSDTLIKTQELIEYLADITAKNKVLFLDCCMAGNFDVNGTAVFNINETADEFAGKGYAVIASCSAQQYSYGHPEKPLSLFTYFLCQALTHKLIIREGKKSLYDIKKLLFLMLDVWNKNNPSKTQTPIYRANIGGTIYFDVQDYCPYIVEKFFWDCESYTIYTVKPLHCSNVKKYSVQVILKQPMSFSEISDINHEIVQTVKHLEIYQSQKQEEKWRGTDVNLVFCNFGLDETDMMNSNYLCHTTWADETQDKNWWYRLSENCEVINGIHFKFYAYYQNRKSFIKEHTATKENLVAETRDIITRMATLAEKVISQYNEFLNGAKTEADFKNDMTRIAPELNKLYFSETSLDIPPDDLKEWCQLCSNLAGSIHGFSLYYGEKQFSERTPENRKACMSMAIKQYYEDLEKLNMTLPQILCKRKKYDII